MLCPKKPTWLSGLLPEAGWLNSSTLHPSFGAIGCNLCSLSVSASLPPCILLDSPTISLGLGSTGRSDWWLSVTVCLEASTILHDGKQYRHAWLAFWSLRQESGGGIIPGGAVRVGVRFVPRCLPIPIVRLRQRYLQCHSLLHVRMSCSGGHSRRRVWLCNASCFLLLASAFSGCWLCPINSSRPCPPWTQPRQMRGLGLNV